MNRDVNAIVQFLVKNKSICDLSFRFASATTIAER
jgi:hypothetical protein